MNILQQLLGFGGESPAPQQPQLQAQPMGGNFQGIDIQGSQNPGYVPMQGSNGVGPLQGGNPQIMNILQHLQGIAGQHRGPLQYAQYMNADGTGGGYGPNPAASRQQRRPVFGRDLQPTIELEGVNPIQMQQYGPETNYATGIQGTQNQGYTPLQGSRGVRPIQGGSGPSINFR